MKIPKRIKPLVEDGLVDDVVRQLRSGKEASVFVVRCDGETRCAKVYKEAHRRSFHKQVEYQEGRKVRSGRRARAMAKNTRYGRREQEAVWQSAEVDALRALESAGVRVPRVHQFIDGVLIMELVTDAHGNAAPQLGDVVLTATQARDYHRFLIDQIVRMLCAGLIHGDLSEYNVLVDDNGPVIIDLPQIVEAAGNNNACRMLVRDVDNMTAYLGRFAPELQESDYAAEIWALFERGELGPHTPLTGRFERDEQPADVDDVLREIAAAREEALERRQSAEFDED